MTTKKGILKYIANSGAKGCKFEDDPNTWFNPSSEEAKQQIKDDFKGKLVEINLVEGKKTMFSSMILCEEKEEEQPVVTEEQMGEEPEEEKVPQTPPKEEEEEPDPDLLEEDEIDAEERSGPAGSLIPFYTGPHSNNASKEYTQAAFAKMNETKVKIDKKGNLNYASWAEVWRELKKIHPTSKYQIHENREGLPFFNDETLGAFVKVSVTVMGLTHTVHLPVMNNTNKAAKGVQLDVVLINKNIQRAFAKAIAMHGMGLYVYNGEDLPEDN